jgi:cyanamide hydratase
LFNGKRNDATPTPQTVGPEPDSQLAKAVDAYAKQKLPLPTYNHSKRVYHYGRAITKDQFPDWGYDPEVFYCICLLHDIGATDENIDINHQVLSPYHAIRIITKLKAIVCYQPHAATKMSFEFYEGFLARELILQHSNQDKDYADAVCEAVIRHQDIGDIGYIANLGLLIQSVTLLDNIGQNLDLIDRKTIDDVNKHFPRHDWQNCFAKTIRKENAAKPWSHTTALGVDNFPNGVLANKEMPYP